MVTYITGKATVECPFGRKVAVAAFHRPSFKQAKTSRISAGAKTDAEIDELVHKMYGITEEERRIIEEGTGWPPP